VPCKGALRALWGALLALLVAGCGVTLFTANSDPLITTLQYPVWVDASFSTEQKSAIHQALFRWNVALGGYARFQVYAENIARPSHSYIVNSEAARARHYVTIDRAIDGEEPDPSYLAWTDSTGGHVVTIITERVELWSNDRDVTLHELGHVLGLPDDIANRNTLMAIPVSAMRPCISDMTLRELAMVHHWDITHMVPECD
jgi:hypothetical protein